MKRLNSFEEKLIVGAVVALGGYLLYRKLAGVVSAAIPPVVKEGAQATTTLATEAVNIAAHPLDAFGVSPAMSAGNTPIWTPTVPWNNPDNPVSDNPAGIDFSQF